MKKLNLLFVILFIAAAMMSCNLVDWNTLTDVDNDFDVVSRSAIYRGGNASCDQLGAFGIEGLVKTTNRNNYIPTTDGFETGWPSGLIVMVSNDKSVSFQIDGSINLGDGKCYKVGAVIVKGSDASNIYSYPNGTDHDINLLPPTNASGGPAGLSNLTFCFVECKEQPQLVVGFKSYINGYTGFVTSGSYITAYPLVLGASYKLYHNLYPGDPLSTSSEAGNLKITDTDNDGFWEITVDNIGNFPGLTFYEPFLYVGTAADFDLDYQNYPYPNPKVTFDPPKDTWTFELPF